MQNFEAYPEKKAVITAGGALRDQIINAFRAGALLRWKTELVARIIPENRDIVRKAREIESDWVTDQDAYNWNKISTLYIENGDYFKIQNVTLGYNIAKAFKNFPLQTLRVYVTAQNPFTFTKYSGMDPEIGYGGDSYGWAQGIDLGYYPSSRNFLVGISLKF
jgi:hypothetical protein